MREKTIRQFLIDRQTDGRWDSELSNWTGNGLYSILSNKPSLCLFSFKYAILILPVGGRRDTE